MKTMIFAIVALVIAAGAVLEFRYSLIVDSPVVAKIDRLTGDVWVANSGAWRKIDHARVEIGADEEAAVSTQEKKSE